MKRRSGITLIEVLVAIFVMALGMIALLTLFPIGALQMAQSIQDERAAQCAANANAIAMIKNLRADGTPAGVIGDVPQGPNDVFAMDLGVGAPTDNGLSNPILVDPAG